MRTYDIINAGPKNRFMANGKIVSNSGRMFQPQNLPRLNLDAIAKWFGISARDVKQKHADEYLDFGVETILANCEDMFFDDSMLLLANGVRGAVIAPPGKKLIVSDLSNIEGRIGAWLAGEEWKLQAFRDYDAGLGPDLYCVAYGKSFGIDPREVSKPQRQIGKIQELFLQYAGGVGAFVTGAATYRVDLEAMAEKAIEAIPMDTLKEAENFMEWMRDKGMPMFGLSDRAYIVCESFKRLWREAHPAITTYWALIEKSMNLAFESPREVFKVGPLRMQYIKDWLRIRFPDGSYICYPQFKVEPDGTFSFMGIDQYSKQWQRITTHKGKQFENDCQAFARNIFFSSLQPAEDAGYEIVLRVHDENVAEAPDTDDYSAEELSAIMATNLPYAKDLPLAAAGHEMYRYRKEV